MVLLLCTSSDDGFYFISSSAFNAYLMQIKVVMSTVSRAA